MKQTNTNRSDIDLLFEGEYSLLAQERHRRSSEQTNFIKIVLIGIAAQVGIVLLEIINFNNLLLDSINQEKIELFLYLVSGLVVLVSVTLFLFWLDHALTILMIDKYLKQKELDVKKEGWFAFREAFSKNTKIKGLFGSELEVTRVKIFFFQIAVLISFLTPSVIFFFVITFSSYLEKNMHFIKIGAFFLFAVIFLLLLYGIRTWFNTSRNIYWTKEKIQEKDSL
ncbi:MAG: hypothetical protein IBX45_13660 [Campylobacterales bacterium]|nr:hypothetical protein [Campylobacterales bacterium]